MTQEQEISKIITHSGTAHQDEFLACCLILTMAKKQQNFIPEIERRNPTEEELNNPNVWVIDVGGQYDPDKNNFDHHHDPELPCSLHLIAEKFGINDSCRSAFDWWDSVDFQDRNGVLKLYQKIIGEGSHDPVNPKNISRFASPISSTVLKIFSQMENVIGLDVEEWTNALLGGDIILELMQQIGKELTSSLHQFEVDSKEVEVQTLNNEQGTQVALCRKANNVARFKVARQKGCELLVEPDVREPQNFKITAIDGAPFDFRQLAKTENVVFIHNSGFMAVVSDDIENYWQYVPVVNS